MKYWRLRTEEEKNIHYRAVLSKSAFVESDELVPKIGIYIKRR
jgi:hypothetical protein